MSEKSAWTGARPHIDKSELLCKMGCGYYGNPAWDGHCSKCYKEMMRRKQQRRTVFDPTQIKNKVTQSVSDVSELQSKASSIVSRKLDRFDAKMDKRTKAVKSIFKKSPSIRSPVERGKITRQYSEESQVVMDEFYEFIKPYSPEFQSFISRQVKSFEERIKKLSLNQTVDDLGEMFQDFYNGFNDAVCSHTLSADMSQDDSMRLTELSERYITTRNYKILLSVVNPYSEEKDLAIQERIRSLMWVTCSHLECNVDDANEGARLLLDQVISDLIEIDSKRSPSEKLSLLVSASHQVLNLLQKSNGGSPASADDFLPALIYCLLKANPPLLQSNICYITTFAQQDSLQSGEAGYFFTNLCCAVSFIEKLTAESLGLTRPEFDHYMSGDALPPNALQDGYLCEGLQLMKQNVANLNDCEATLSAILKSYDDLAVEADELKATIDNGVDELLRSCPVVLGPRRANIDEPDPTQESLPPPLLPQNTRMEPSSATNLTSQLDHFPGPRSLDSFYEGAEPPPCVPHKPPSPSYTGFTIQGGRIPSIPCDTGFTHSHPPSDSLDSFRESLPPPLLPLSGNRRGDGPSAGAEKEKMSFGNLDLL